MQKSDLILYMKDLIGPRTAAVLEWTTDEAYDPAVRELLFRFGVSDISHVDDEQQLRLETDVVIWEKVRAYTASFHYMTSPDNITAQLQQIHSQADMMAGRAYLNSLAYTGTVETRSAAT